MLAVQGHRQSTVRVCLISQGEVLAAECRLLYLPALWQLAQRPHVCRKEYKKKRKEHIFRRQTDEKPSIIPSCPSICGSDWSTACHSVEPTDMAAMMNEYNHDMNRVPAEKANQPPQRATEGVT